MNVEIPLPGEKRPASFFKYLKKGLAAAVLIAAGIWIYKTITPTTNNRTFVTTTPSKDDTPVLQLAFKAELKLADGRKILLHESPDGLIASDGGYQISKYKDLLVYAADNGASMKETIYNTVTTPNGGQFSIELPDHTTLRLNVASEVKYKVSLAAPTREADVIKGEAFFEVAKNIGKKFWVALPKGKIEVTGTRFNVSTEDDIKKITLLQGGLNVHSSSSNHPTVDTLHEGDQAQLHENGDINILHNVDTTAIVSWKNGILKFSKTPVKTVLNKLEKWYDVKVDMKASTLLSCPITGKIKPGFNIQSVLHTMEEQCGGLHLKYDSSSRKIIVLP